MIINQNQAYPKGLHFLKFLSKFLILDFIALQEKCCMKGWQIIKIVQNNVIIFLKSNQILSMFPPHLPLRETIQLKALAKRTISPPQCVSSCINHPLEPCKKIETQIIYVNDSLNSSIINDNNYNTMVYQWRKVQLAPIVRVIEIGRVNEINAFMGVTYTYKTITSEPIQCYLSSLNQFSKEQSLKILKNMLDGHQAIFKKLKATSVSLDKTVITAKGEIKVWTNQQLERNQISGEVLNNQEQIVKRIFQIFSFLAKKDMKNCLNDFVEYVNASMKRNGKWSFSYLRALIKSYSGCLKLKLAKPISQIFNEKTRSTQKLLMKKSDTGIQSSKRVSLKRARKSSVGNRSIQSILNISKGLRHQSQTFQPCKQSITSTHFVLSGAPTRKTMNEILLSDKVLTEKSLLKSKHTNSVSRLIVEQIGKNNSKQNSNGNNKSKSNLSFQKSGSLQHLKYPSINQILFNKIGFTSLPEVQDEQCFSPSRKKYPEKQSQGKVKNFTIVQEVDVKIDKCGEPAKPYKGSSISTTNQTSISGSQFCFARIIKDSSITINLEDKGEKKLGEEMRTASIDKFEDGKPNDLPKKTMASCTNWANKINSFDLKTIMKPLDVSCMTQTKQEEYEDSSLRSSSKLQVDKQIFSYQNIQDTTSKSQQRRKQAVNHSIQEQTPFFQSSPSRKQIPKEILELFNFGKRMTTSTYMQSGSQTQIKAKTTQDNQKSKKVKEFEEAFSQLMGANVKQQEIISGNCWTKTLQTLVGLEQSQLKQSISIGIQQASALIHQMKLSKLGKWGRDIGKSVIPE